MRVCQRLGSVFSIPTKGFMFRTPSCQQRCGLARVGFEQIRASSKLRAPTAIVDMQLWETMALAIESEVWL